MENLKLLNWLFIFLIGFLSCAFLFYILSFGIEIPQGGSNVSVPSPSDWISAGQIKVYDNAIVINVDNASISSYAATGSMMPVLYEKSNGIRIVPSNPEKINVGDIVTFQQGENLIVHRVVEKGEDSQGYWFITKGDNAPARDSVIRFSDIKYVTIGVLY